eukprot:CAMPEP_0204552080 /NCGR_PEP_ID=MMETSP0661-20131031/26375_1 /ASSEMBLY_ACC=CAM_ASM_000606 /TAXON_ID=109239 /ORGANISM="Alexandrium margalefi, Strain AMGDE01CS-322" /LENGTH=68 /DNA_ID=CAMNT_0051559081 /DNA_START=49 /DNA_END=255 /DNA_ORIENTATION=+
MGLRDWRLPPGPRQLDPPLQPLGQLGPLRRLAHDRKMCGDLRGTDAEEPFRVAAVGVGQNGHHAADGQ